MRITIQHAIHKVTYQMRDYMLSNDEVNILRALMVDDLKITAIKYIREKRMNSLLEAKEIVEQTWEVFQRDKPILRNLGELLRRQSNERGIDLMGDPDEHDGR